MERGERDLMKRKPRSSTDGIFAGGLGPELLYQGILIAAQTIFAYALGYNNVDDVTGLHNHAITMAFLTLSMCEVFHAFNMRSQHGPARKPQLGALWRNGALRAADDNGDLCAIFGRCFPSRSADGNGVF